MTTLWPVRVPSGTGYGIRTRDFALKGRCRGPLDECATGERGRGHAQQSVTGVTKQQLSPCAPQLGGPAHVPASADECTLVASACADAGRSVGLKPPPHAVRRPGPHKDLPEETKEVSPRRLGLLRPIAVGDRRVHPPVARAVAGVGSVRRVVSLLRPATHLRIGAHP